MKFKDVLKTKTPGVRNSLRLVDEDLGAKRMSVRLTEYEPRAVHKHYHYHEKRETVYIALEGNATLKLNGIEHQLKPNTVVFIPPSDKHAVTRVGEEGFKMLEITSPVSSKDIIYVQE